MTLSAQWTMLNSPTKSDLRSVHAADGSVWAAGDGGTILRSIDDGGTWNTCLAPKGKEHASLRSIQAMEADTALVISDGKGVGSRVYRTSDGCKSWQEVFVNPDADSSFVSLRRLTSRQVYLLASPVAGKFAMYFSQDGGKQWFILDDPGLDASKEEDASGTVLFSQGPFLYFGTGGATPPALHYTLPQCSGSETTACPVGWVKADLSMPGAPAGAVVTSVATHMQTSMAGKISTALLAVGGVPSAQGGAPFAALSPDGKHWKAVTGELRGFRTALATDTATQTVLAVGPNGTDLSLDYGQTWKAPKNGIGTEGNGWTAISLPFVVGTNGQIGKLIPEALKR